MKKKHTQIWIRRMGWLLSALLLFTSLPIPNSYAEEEIVSDNTIKVGFIYNFSKFIKWPSDRSNKNRHNTFTICLLGNDPLGSLLDQLAAIREIKNKAIQILKNPAPNHLKNCKILYISSSESSRLDSILEKLEGYPTLTIGSQDGYAKRGVGINLFKKSDMMSFEINRKAILKAGLTISSDLLNLGVLVDTGD